MLSNISDLFTMASLVICMLLSGIIFYYLRTRISMLEQSVMDQAQLLQQVVTSLKSSQYRQQMNANSNTNANANMISAQQHQDFVKSSEMQMNLIQVSDDDSDDSDSSESSDSDDSESDSSDDSESGVNVCTLEGSCSKIIDLSTIASSANYLKPSSSHSEIKVIELKSNIRSDKDYLGNSSHDEDEDDGDDDDDEDEDDDDDDEDEDEDDEDRDDDEDEDENMNGEKNDARNENDIESKNDESENQSHRNINIKKMKSIVIEDPTTSVSLDEMKNMPVNSLRSLAKTKLSNIDVPTINKMSKKDILKALHEE